jgi:hypothetical protein
MLYDEPALAYNNYFCAGLLETNRTELTDIRPLQVAAEPIGSVETRHLPYGWDRVSVIGANGVIYGPCNIE